MSLTAKIEKLIALEDKKIELLKQVIKKHQLRIKYLRDMTRIASEVGESER